MRTTAEKAMTVARESGDAGTEKRGGADADRGRRRSKLSGLRCWTNLRQDVGTEPCRTCANGA